MPGLDSENPSNGSSHFPNSASSSSSNSVSSAIGSPSQQTIRNRLPATSTEWNNNRTTTTTTTTTASLLPRQPFLDGSCDSHVTTSSGSSASGGGGGDGVRKFTWKELSLLHQRHNAHVAYRGKVSVCVSVIMYNINW